MIECATFWLLYLGPGFVVDFMAFTTVYTLHKAGVYTICILVADLMAHHLAPSWGAYGKRSVSKQWLIWSLGLAVGFILQRTMVKSLVPLYAPDVVAFFIANPLARLSNLTLLMVLLPYWLVVVFLTLQVITAKQRVQQLAASLVVSGEDRSGEKETTSSKDKSAPAGILRIDNGKGMGAIALADISHVTVEDHYCRINYATIDGPKAELIRLPLKRMLNKLPADHFVHIHRSHVVNTGHVARITKSGRDHKVLMEGWDVALPISRSRFKHLDRKLRQVGFDK
jgi:DNA-binding LytR/AlgR family response regulator